MSFAEIILVIIVLLHLALAIGASVVLSTIVKKYLPGKYLLLGLSWIVPFFGFLFFVKGGKYVPSIGANSYIDAVATASTEYQQRKREENKINSHDSGYGGSTSASSDSGDGE